MVSFNENNKIYVLPEEDRTSQWVQAARDRYRFLQRILEAEKLLAPVLSAEHRARRQRSFLVIDIQGFNAPSFTPKEMSISDGVKSIHMLFKPAVPFRSLLPCNQRQIIWLENNYLHLKYSWGLVDLKDIKSILCSISSSYSVIYVKGHQKVRFLNSILDIEVMNLEDVDNVPNLVKTDKACFYHKKDCTSMCTEHNVKILLDYVNNFRL